MRRILGLLGIGRRQTTGLLVLGLVCAAFEAVGVSLLLPVLRYVERPAGGALEQRSWLEAMAARVAETSGLSVLLVLVVAAFLPVLGRQVFRYIHQVYAEHLRLDAVARLRREAFGAFLDARLSFVVAQGQGRLMSVITSEMERGAAALPVFLQIGESVILLGAYVGLLLILAPCLVPVVLLAMAAVGLAVRARIRYARAYGERIAVFHETLHASVAEKLAGIRLIKMRGREARETERVGDIADVIKRMFSRLAREREGIEVSIEPLMVLGAFVTLYVAVARFGMTVASLGVFMLVLLRMVPLLRQVNVARQTVGSLVGALDSIWTAIDSARAARDAVSGTKAFPGLRHELAFEHVDFSYGGADDTWALHDISFRAGKGSLIAIVGRSGAGKSTLLDLIPRLRDVTGGAITIDGVSARDFGLAGLRSAIGVVDQEGFLFDDTVANNIAYGVPLASRAAIVDAARGAHAHSFIEELPQGYETVVGERGIRLSVGQRQRISLARVLLQDPDILLLDEPTSALDSESEQYIQAVLDRLRGSKVVIVVAHRLSTIRHADQILVLDHGRIVERGDHESLLRDWGTYKKLFELQIQA